MGSGVKNEDNTFTGIVMGEMSKVNEEKNQVGLYGYHHGVESFGFNSNGTAFLGKSGAGRIEIDGDNGTISSTGWNIDHENLQYNLIDRDRGAIMNLKNGDFIL
jgi:hypothetical protein